MGNNKTYLGYKKGDSLIYLNKDFDAIEAKREAYDYYRAFYEY